MRSPSTSTVHAPHGPLVAALLGAGKLQVLTQQIENRDTRVVRCVDEMID
jgi:hypothetical protein